MHPERVPEGRLQSCLRGPERGVSSVSRGRVWGSLTTLLPGGVGACGQALGSRHLLSSLCLAGVWLSL